jgi:hypothetical protein
VLAAAAAAAVYGAPVAARTGVDPSLAILPGVGAHRRGKRGVGAHRRPSCMLTPVAEAAPRSRQARNQAFSIQGNARVYRYVVHTAVPGSAMEPAAMQLHAWSEGQPSNVTHI